MALPAVEGFYIGGQVGYLALTNSTTPTIGNALGFGVDLGFRTNPVLDLTFGSQLSAHSGGLSLWANTVSASYMVGVVNDIEFFIGGGPGFYAFNNTGATEAKFGLHAGFHGDLVVSDAVKIGLGWRFHGIFGPAINQSSYWQIMMRVGFYFGN